MQKEELKIAFVIGDFPNVPEQGWFIDQIIGLKDLGVKIDIFAFKKGPTDKISAKTKKYRLLEGVTYFDPPGKKIKRAVLALSAFLKLIFLRPAAIWRAFNFKKYGLGVFSLKYLFWAANAAGRMEQYEVVHCHLGMIANKFLVIKDILKLKCKIVATFYGQDSSKYIKAKGLSVYDKLKKEASYILLMTEEMKERFIGLGFPPEKLLVHYTAVNPGYYRFTPRLYHKSELFKMIFVGRFVEKKGLDDLFRAIKVLGESFDNFELCVVGGAAEIPYGEYLDKMVRDLKIEKYVKFTGLLTFEKILDIYSKSHLMVQLSKTAPNGDTDDLPYVLLEGQISGLPVVTTSHVGIPDGVLDGKSGFLVSEGDFKAAAEKILFFVNHPDKIQEFSENAHKFICDKFDIRAYNRRLLGLYKSLL